MTMDNSFDTSISRRNLLKVGAASCLVLPCYLTATAQAKAQDITPKTGGHLKFGLPHGSTSDTLDPGKIDNGFLFALTFMVFNNLVEIGPDGSPVGELAESWESDETAQNWIFKLRKDVTFHDGKKLTADDVIASINHHRGPDTTSGIAPLIADVSDISVGPTGELLFQLSSGNVDFPATLAGQGFFIKQAKDGKIDIKSGIGTGGYKLDSFEPGVSATGLRYAGYWKSGRAHADTVTLISILDSAARTNAIQTGEVDMIEGVDLKTVSLLKRAGTVEVESVPGNLHYTFSMQVDADPFKDVNIRLALKYGIDRQSLVEKVLSGHGVVGNDHPIGPAYPEHTDDLPQRAYDPQKAAWHLKKAGLATLDVSLSAADAAFPGAIDAASLYSESVKAAGINLAVVREPNDGYWTNVWLKKPFVSVFWGGQPTASAMLSLAYSSRSDWNDAHWKNNRFDELLKASMIEFDPDKRRQQFREMQMLIRDDGGTIVPMFSNLVFAKTKRTRHAEIGNLVGPDNYRFAERWWIDET